MDSIVQEDILKLLLAMVLGGLIGAEREYRSKSAGLRTTILICVGSALFTIVSRRFSDDDRIAANIVNGIGFLGAGIIFRQETSVKGLTTAATIWAVAAIGMAVGGGFYDLAVGGFVIIGATLLVLPALASRIARANQARQFRIVTTFKHKTLLAYETLFEECGLHPRLQSQQRIGTEIIGIWRVTGSEKAHERCIRHLLNDPEVKEFGF
ncbi:MgtC/SapB family protein [Larkinella punicea]|uniref:MgtC/SapB family protein n=1 Tax=Larkinella punicea TaxID=2315727 RepID=A0A368JL97_9BACT|nr:MgtC/SapB family protein [Larkinella punicea]RCR67333.1 MgtC/SapB family protein [Larkinella punicea]